MKLHSCFNPRVLHRQLLESTEQGNVILDLIFGIRNLRTRLAESARPDELSHFIPYGLGSELGE
eukprot:m.9981 g.9981  ORF g.9981 m.9981 type:complete len:64 (+) comp21788_c0_seq2:2-193(+)